MEKIKASIDKIYATINSSKQELAFAKGGLQQQLKELSEKYGLKSLSEAEKKIQYLTNQKLKLKQEITKKYETIKENYL